jgi:N-acetylneuraminic acid mutarotase
MYEGKMLVVCGYTSESYCALIHSYNFEDGLWEELPTGGDAPMPRSACTVAIHDHKLYMFGGWNGHHSNNDFYVYDLKEGTWAKIDSSDWTPSSRRSHCAIQYRDAMYVWGGYGVDGNCDISVYKFDFTTQEWSISPARNSGPAPRSRARAVRVYDRMVITGGWDRVDHFDDWWEFNLTTGEWYCRHVKLPHPVAQHAAVPWKNSVIVFGGFDDTLKRSCDGFWSYSMGHLHTRSA